MADVGVSWIFVSLVVSSALPAKRGVPAVAMLLLDAKATLPLGFWIVENPATVDNSAARRKTQEDLKIFIFIVFDCSSPTLKSECQN